MIYVLAAAAKNINIATARYKTFPKAPKKSGAFFTDFFEKYKAGNYILNVDGYLY